MLILDHVWEADPDRPHIDWISSLSSIVSCPRSKVLVTTRNGNLLRSVVPIEICVLDLGVEEEGPPPHAGPVLVRVVELPSAQVLFDGGVCLERCGASYQETSKIVPCS